MKTTKIRNFEVSSGLDDPVKLVYGKGKAYVD